MKSDRLIKIFIADEAEPVHLSEKLLLRTSSWFETALQSKWETELGVLRFPDDSLDSWKLFIFWMNYKRIPKSLDILGINDCEISHLVRCWILGDKYLVPLFQDAVMIELFQCLHAQSSHYPRQYSLNSGTEVHLDFIQEGFEGCAPGSELRKLLAEYLIWDFKTTHMVTPTSFDMFDGICGVTGEVLKALELYESLSTRRHKPVFPLRNATEYLITSDAKLHGMKEN